MAEKDDNIKLENPLLKLPKTRVVFFNPEDEGFGRSITIDATDPEIKEKIEQWVKENKIGKEEPGVPKFKEYTSDDGKTTIQFSFKINDHTAISGLHGLGAKDIGYGAMVRIAANAFTYNNKFTGGKTRVGQSAQAILVCSPSSHSGEAVLEELFAEEQGNEAEAPDDTISAEEIPF